MINDLHESNMVTDYPCMRSDTVCGKDAIEAKDEIG